MSSPRRRADAPNPWAKLFDSKVQSLQLIAARKLGWLRTGSELDCDLTAGYVSAYVKSTVAERVAWDFVAKEGDALELAVVNPVGVFGPTRRSAGRRRF